MKRISFAERKAYSQGEEAGKKGYTIDACIYVNGTDLYNAWLNGYGEGMAERLGVSEMARDVKDMYAEMQDVATYQNVNE